MTARGYFALDLDEDLATEGDTLADDDRGDEEDVVEGAEIEKAAEENADLGSVAEIVDGEDTGAEDCNGDDSSDNLY